MGPASRSHQRIWCASHHDGGALHQAHPPSRSTSASRWAGLNSLRSLPQSSTSDSPPSTAGMTSASAAARRSAPALTGWEPPSISPTPNPDSSSARVSRTTTVVFTPLVGWSQSNACLQRPTRMSARICKAVRVSEEGSSRRCCIAHRTLASRTARTGAASSGVSRAERVTMPSASSRRLAKRSMYCRSSRCSHARGSASACALHRSFRTSCRASPGALASARRSRSRATTVSGTLAMAVPNAAAASTDSAPSLTARPI